MVKIEDDPRENRLSPAVDAGCIRRATPAGDSRPRREAGLTGPGAWTDWSCRDSGTLLATIAGASGRMVATTPPRLIEALVFRLSFEPQGFPVGRFGGRPRSPQRGAAPSPSADFPALEPRIPCPRPGRTAAARWLGTPLRLASGPARDLLRNAAHRRNLLPGGATQGRGSTRRERALPVKDAEASASGLEAVPEQVGHPATERLRRNGAVARKRNILPKFIGSTAYPLRTSLSRLETVTRRYNVYIEDFGSWSRRRRRKSSIATTVTESVFLFPICTRVWIMKASAIFFPSNRTTRRLWCLQMQ